MPAIELAERLCSLSYSNMDAVFFANSGSEANEVAFKLARFYWFLQGKMDKVKIFARRQAYHGGTLATTAATGLPPFWRGFGPLDPTFLRTPCNHPFTSCTADCAAAFEEAISARAPTRWRRSSPSRCRAPAASSRPAPTTSPSCARSATSTTSC